MSYEVPSDLLRLVEPEGLLSYLEATGWKRIDGFRPSVAVYRREGPQIAEVKVPLDHAFADFMPRVEDAVRDISESEQRPVSDVLRDVLLPSDGMLFEFRGGVFSFGTMTLESAQKILNGAERIMVGDGKTWQRRPTLDAIGGVIRVLGRESNNCPELLCRFEPANKADGLDLRLMFPIRGNGLIQSDREPSQFARNHIQTRLELLAATVRLLTEGDGKNLEQASLEDSSFVGTTLAEGQSDKRNPASVGLILLDAWDLLDALLDLYPGHGGSLTVSAANSKSAQLGPRQTEPILVTEQVFAALQRAFEEHISMSKPVPHYYVGRVSKLQPDRKQVVELLVVDDGPALCR
ncbi:MAG: hypothetical protein ACREDR_03985, partial [Blastocatellia bacterium]